MDRRPDQRAFLDGVDKDGNGLFPIMPYYVLHNMSSEDADAIVAYLRTIPAIDNPIPPKNFMFPAMAVPPPVPAAPDPQSDASLDGSQLRQRHAREVLGRQYRRVHGVPYEARSDAGACRRSTKLFAGGEGFDAAAIGLPSSFPVRLISLRTSRRTPPVSKAGRPPRSEEPSKTVSKRTACRFAPRCPAVLVKLSTALPTATRSISATTSRTFRRSTTPWRPSATM